MDDIAGVQKELLSHIITGATNKQIAHVFGVDAMDVQRLLKRTYAHLGFNNRTQLAVWAYKNGVREP